MGGSINERASGNAKLSLLFHYFGTFSAVAGEHKAMNCLEQGASKATSGDLTATSSTSLITMFALVINCTKVEETSPPPPCPPVPLPMPVIPHALGHASSTSSACLFGNQLVVGIFVPFFRTRMRVHDTLLTSIMDYSVIISDLDMHNYPCN